VYRWPHGYGYVRYRVGAYLPRAYWVGDYYIDDYVAFGLAVPPPDYQWMRYGPDAVLFDLNTGEIADVVPGAFEESADVGDDGYDDSGDDGDDQGGPDN